MPAITLSWAANSTIDNVVGYDVYGANGTGIVFGSTAKLATVNALTWTDTGLPNSQARTYYVVARNAVGASSSVGPLNISSSALSGAYVQNAGGTPSIQEDTHANRPAAGTAGRLFVETDTKTIWRDNGASWDQLDTSGGSGNSDVFNQAFIGGV